MECSYTRWIEAVPLSSIDADSVSSAFLRHWVYRFGPPVAIHSDQGTQFESRVFYSLCRILGSLKTRTTTYHPEGNSMLERFHRTLGDRLRTCPKPKDWVNNLPSALFAYRTSIHSATGQTPFSMTYGFTPTVPSDWPCHFRSFHPESFVADLRSYWSLVAPSPGSHGKAIWTPTPGEKVLVRRLIRQKLDSPYHPPAEVIKTLGPCVVDVKDHGPVHINRIKKFPSGGGI